MKKTIFLFIIILAMVFAEGCAPSKPILEERLISADRLIKKLEANRRKIKNFKGTGVLSINSSEMNAKSNFEVLIKKPDSLKVSFYGPFGIDLAHALITQKNFLFYDVINNTLYRGSMRNGIIKQILKFELPLDEIIDALAGSINLTDKLRAEPDKFEQLDDLYKLTYSDPIEKTDKIFIVNSEDLAIKENVLQRSDGKILVEGKFSRFNTYDGVPIPLEINLNDLTNKQRLKIEYRKIEVNQNLVNMKFDIPSDVKIKEW